MFRSAFIAAFLLAIVQQVSAVPVDHHHHHHHHDERLFCFTKTDCQWMTLEKAIEYRRTHESDCTDFIDFTDHKERMEAAAPRPHSAFPPKPQHEATVKSLLAKLDANRMEGTITKLAEYPNRYYTSPNGAKAMEWLRGQFEAASAHRSDVSIRMFKHREYDQPTLIVRVEGNSLPDEVVVVGAHADSISGVGGPTVQAPGADDDASGVANLLEAFHAIVSTEFAPNRTVEFIAYAAEEVGLRGSMDIAADYEKHGIKVHAVYQCEMSGYKGGDGVVTLLTDFVDPALVNFTAGLVDTYLSIGYKKTECGYGCSDHAAWTQHGYPAMCAAEAGPFDHAALNPGMHTSNDVVGNLDMKFCKEFAALAAAFAVELSFE